MLFFIGPPGRSRRRNWFTDFGAVGDGVTDDSDAIKEAIAYAATKGRQVVIPSPPVAYLIDEDNVFHPDSVGVSSGFGLNFCGEAQNYAIIRLKRNPGVPRYFYNSDNNPGWNRQQFENIWFQSDCVNPQLGQQQNDFIADCRGFKIWASIPGGGVDKGNIFRNCRFSVLGEPVNFIGTANTDTYNAYSCWYSGCGPICIDNDQALLITFYSCHFWTSGDQFWIKNTTGNGQQGKGGGGSIKIVDGDMIMQSLNGDATSYYTLRIDDGAAFYRNFTFDHCKWEFRGRGSKLLYWNGNASFLTGSQVLFTNGCDLSVAQQGAGYGGDEGNDVNGIREMIVLGPHRRVLMRDAILPSQFAIRFDSVNTGAVVGYHRQGVLELEGCLLPWQMVSGVADNLTDEDTNRRLSSRITLHNGYGRVIGRNNGIRDASTSERLAISDFDYNGKNAVRGEQGQQGITRYYFKTENQAWPTNNGNERTLMLLEGSEIVSMGINKPAGGSVATTDITYQITNDDKSEVYCETGPWRADGHHKAIANEQTDPQLFPLRIPVGATRSQRRLRFIMPTAHGYTAPTGDGTGGAWVDVRH